MNLLLELAFESAGITLLVMGYAPARGWLGRNRWIGIRTPATLRSDAAWLAAHQVARPWMVASGVALLGAVCCLGAMPPSPGTALVACLAVAVVGACTVMAALRGHRAARALT